MNEDEPPVAMEATPSGATAQPDPRRILRHANWIQLLNATLLFAAAGIAAWSVISTQRTARLMAADATWERYMELAFQYPNLESGTVNFQDGTSAADVQYAWFVERGLFAGDQIMAVEPDDPQWQDAIAWEAQRHKRYILSNTFLLDSPAGMSSFCTYRRPLRDIIIRTLRSDPRAARRLDWAEARCRATLRERGSPTM